ncbi:MAG: hypothetical protein H6721_04765 [Sandaracinus sp.]|nr:hypothetical protein [Sandaracinus sp.]MCB9631439.1 hypothetical protein [Sandaracinus sp.]
MALRWCLIPFLLAAACSGPGDTGSTPDLETRAPILEARRGTELVEAPPLATIPPSLGDRVVGPAFELSASDEPRELTLHAEDAWPEDVEVPEGVSLAWQGAEGLRLLETERRGRSWHARLPARNEPGHVFLTTPSPAEPCALRLPPDIAAARRARCPDEPATRVDLLARALCGADVDPSTLAESLRALPCEASLSDLSSLRPEAFR